MTPDLSEALRNCGAHAVAAAEAKTVPMLVGDFRAIEVEILNNRFSNDGKEDYLPLKEDLLKRMAKLSFRIIALREVVVVAQDHDAATGLRQGKHRIDDLPQGALAFEQAPDRRLALGRLFGLVLVEAIAGEPRTVGDMRSRSGGRRLCG